MKNSSFSLKLIPSDPAAKLGFEVWVNDHCVTDIEHVAETMTVTCELPPDDVDAQHCLKLVLKNKTSQHTQVSSTGEILADAVLEISELAFDGIPLGHIVADTCCYHHDFNGSQAPVTDQFFGIMGCNGTVELEFSTPIYLWLLENM